MPLSPKNIMTDWSKVEKYYDLGNTAGYALSLLEAEAMLRKILREKKLAGKTTEEKLSSVRHSLSQYQSLKISRQLTHEIISLKLPSVITKQAAEQILRTYFTAITEIEQMPRWEISKINVRHKLQAVQKYLIKLLTYAGLLLIVTLGLTLFLSSTTAGEIIVTNLISWSRFFFYRALPATLITLTVLIIAIALIIRASHKKHPVQNEEVR